jgi:hypothetical protein
VATYKLDFANSYRDRHGKMRHRFRTGNVPRMIQGTPGSAAFMEEYNRLMGLGAPSPTRRTSGERGTLGWAIDRSRTVQQGVGQDQAVHEGCVRAPPFPLLAGQLRCPNFPHHHRARRAGDQK